MDPDDPPVFSDSEAMPLKSGTLLMDTRHENFSSSYLNVTETELLQGYDSDAQSPDNMLTEEYVVGQPDDDGDDVAEITLNQLEEIKQPHADNCMLAPYHFAFKTIANENQMRL